MRLHTCIAALVLALCSSIAQGYKEPTHRLLTETAFDRSVLSASPGGLQDLGLNPSSEFPNSSGASKTVQQLFSDGADFEDQNLIPDFTSLTNRPLRHFYNPVTGEGLFGTFLSSPDWALALPGTVSGQDRSYWNARKSFLDALTKPLEAERQAAFGETFQFIGQVVHHLQDMAQPQHVRNDAHFPLFSNWSRYERWTNDNGGTLSTDFASIGYDITGSAFTSTFNSPRRFWSTEDPGVISASQGKGIAEFTNRNFVSYGSNFVFDPASFLGSPNFLANPNFVLPQPGPVGPLTNITDLIPGTSLHGQLRFIPSQVVDNVLGGTSTTNERASTFSIFDQDLANRGGQPVLSLNSLNFQAAVPFLIPRAVAYSAGMINYFFRGKIDLVPDETNPGTFLIKNLGSEPMTGTFSLYYDDAGDNRTFFATLYNGPVAANGTQNIGTIPDPATLNPAPKTPGQYMLVFTGDMGQETQAQPGGIVVGAIVGKVVEIGVWTITEIDLGGQTPTGINDSDQIAGFGGNPQHAFLWSSGSGMQDLGTLPGDSVSAAVAINNGGQVAGNGGDTVHAWFWSSGSGMQSLGDVPGGDGSTAAYGINNSGQVVGQVGLTGVSKQGAAIVHAFVWSTGSGMQDLQATLPNIEVSYASCINNTGQVVGVGVSLTTFSGDVILWTNGSGTDLGTPGGLGFEAISFQGINDRGQVVAGIHNAQTGAVGVFLWSSGSGWQDLGSLGDSTFYLPVAIDNSGRVLGTRVVANTLLGWLWSSKSGMQTLDSLRIVNGAGWSDLVGYAMSNAGHIVGYGFRNGVHSAFILTPIGSTVNP